MIDITGLREDKRPQSSTIVHALLDRLEAAESDAAHQKALAESALRVAEGWERKCDELRAKIEAMERQKPIATLHDDGYFTWVASRPYESGFAGWRMKVYAIPGAQPPSEQDESVRKSWARFSNELHRSPDAPYPGMSEAFEQHFSQSFTDREWRAESGTWAAAWKAAKNHSAQAQPAPSVPAGWKLVPIVSTDEMDNAGSEHCDGYLSTAQAVWDAMLAAAPEVKP